MADKKDKKFENRVKIVGYLKENNLEKVEVKDKGEVIRGAITIATDESSSYKVQFYVSAVNKSGEENTDFTTLSGLLPEQTTSIASYLKDNPGSTNADAMANATKVWAIARFEEFASAAGERTKSVVSVKGFKAGVKQETEASPFVPQAEFMVDMLVKEIKPEVEYADGEDEEGTETGRLIITGCLPTYDDSMYIIDFIAPVEAPTEGKQKIAELFGATYKAGDTGTFKGVLVNIDKKILQETEDEDDWFGVPAGPQYKTIFIRERVVIGFKKPIHQGEEGCISGKEAKERAAKRQQKALENGKREVEKSKKETASKKEEKKDFAEDMDF